MSSLPVPVSPLISTVVLLLATFFDHVEHALQGTAGADDVVELVDAALLVAEVVDFVAQAPVLERLVDLDLHLLDLERLGHVVEGADLHRLDGRVHRAERGHEDHRRLRLQRLGGPQHVEAVTAAHLQVAQDDVEVGLVQALDGHVAVAGFGDLVPGLDEGAGESAAERVVVVGDEDAAHGWIQEGAQELRSSGIGKQQRRTAVESVKRQALGVRR